MFLINDLPGLFESFPDGTRRINICTNSDRVVLKWYYEKDEEIILLFIARHLREQLLVRELSLYMPYIPHARMDRVKNQEEVFTLKYFCEFVNSLHFDRVIVRDAHSNVALALLHNVVSEPIEGFIKKLTGKLLDPQKDIIFYPDEGSCKRYAELLQFPHAFGLKKRDWKSGRILGLEIYGQLPEAPFNVLIIDDISSYGGTFLHSAKKLKELGAGKVYLYVTHCENSVLNGELLNSGLVEKIFTTKSIFTGEHPLIEIMGGEEDEQYKPIAVAGFLQNHA